MTKNNRGVSLIEVMILVVVMGITMTAVLSYFQAANRSQKIAEAKSVIETLRRFIRNNILDQTAWGYGLLDTYNTSYTGGMGCLASQTPCTASLPGTFYGPINLYASSLPVTAIATASVPTAGYQLSGLPCINFVQPPGVPPVDDDSCPISYQILWRADCPNGALNCVNPSVTVYVNMLWNPGSAILQNWLAPSKASYLTATRGLSAADAEAVIKQNNGYSLYSDIVSRNSGLINEPVTVTQQVVSPPLGPGSGGGGCTFGLPQARLFNTIIDDPGQNVAAVNPGTGVITLNPGTYNCHISSAGYGVNGFSISVLNNSGGGTQIGSTATSWAGAGDANVFAEWTGIITLSQQSDLLVNQACDVTNATDGMGHSFAVNGTYNNDVFATFSCTRTN